MPDRRRILILGCSGSGKSTLAIKLHALTGLPLYHLDNIWWKPDRTHISRDAFDLELERLLREPEWIIDGDYSRTYEVRIRASDTVIFLDYKEAVCMDGIIRRIGKCRPDIPFTETELDPELVQLVRQFHERNRPELLALMDRYLEKEWIILKDRKETDEWLRTWRC